MFFPYDEYTHSSSEKEWKEDVKKKSGIVKYVNILSSAQDDYKSLYSFCLSSLFFRNTFCKESFLYFFLNKFDRTERRLLAKIVFDIFVKSEKGSIGNHSKHFDLALELEKNIDNNVAINANYLEIQKKLLIF
jgi:hypothetical protein